MDLWSDPSTPCIREWQSAGQSQGILVEGSKSRYSRARVFETAVLEDQVSRLLRKLRAYQLYREHSLPGRHHMQATAD
jgi:hypothetical protein